MTREHKSQSNKHTAERGTTYNINTIIFYHHYNKIPANHVPVDFIDHLFLSTLSLAILLLYCYRINRIVLEEDWLNDAKRFYAFFCLKMS